MFDDEEIYLTGSKDLLKIAPYSTLAHWRHEGRGPAYFKFGSKVAYKGADLNAWIESQRVATTDQPDEAVA